jgi:hypothetical protein
MKSGDRPVVSVVGTVQAGGGGSDGPAAAPARGSKELPGGRPHLRDAGQAAQ